MLPARQQPPDRDPRPAGKFAGKQNGLIVTARQETPPMKRNGNQRIIPRALIIKYSGGKTRQRSCKLGPSAILEQMNTLPHPVSILEKSISPCPRRFRRIHAIRTRLKNTIDFRSAGPADFSPDHRHPLQTLRTKHIRRTVKRNAFSAERTGQRQNRGDQRRDPPGKCPQLRPHRTHLLFRTSAI